MKKDIALIAQRVSLSDFKTFFVFTREHLSVPYQGYNNAALQ